MGKNIDVVIVTFNRLEKLKHCLDCYDKQTVPFRNLIIVNNCSTDGTKEFLIVYKDLEHKFNIHLINLDRNIGGSGGFHCGQEYAQTLSPDWILLADDDAYADSNLIKKFNDFINDVDVSDVSAICTAVKRVDGSIDLTHRQVNDKLFTLTVGRNAPENYYEKSFFEVDFLTYVGSFLNTSVLKKAGIGRSDFFIYCDDTEHSVRLRKNGRIICVPELFYIHDSGQVTAAIDHSLLATWRDYYAWRNVIYMCKIHKPVKAISITLLELMRFLTSKTLSREAKKVHWRGIVDGWCGRMGLHHLYKPGWQIKKV